jgi:hypothetical protein
MRPHPARIDLRDSMNRSHKGCGEKWDGGDVVRLKLRLKEEPYACGSSSLNSGPRLQPNEKSYISRCDVNVLESKGNSAQKSKRRSILDLLLILLIFVLQAIL